jgi:hypothetical protein
VKKSDIKPVFRKKILSARSAALPLDVRKGSAFPKTIQSLAATPPGPTIYFKNSGIAARTFFKNLLKGAAFPHIDGQSPNKEL